MSRIHEMYNTYCWKPDPSISVDDNYMDLTLLVTRASKLKHGSMACILVRNIDDNELIEFTLSYFTDRIISASTNKALYTENESDIHAEIAAIGLAACDGRQTLNCTAYITMPPCRKCFAALLCAGVRRIVSRRESPLFELAATHDIDMVTLSDWDGHRDRIKSIVHSYEEQVAIRDADAVENT
jgi:tRNA(Arg) A34 adenosine deaminase TadA